MLPPGHGPRGGAAGLARPKGPVLPGNCCRQSRESTAREPLGIRQLRDWLPGLAKQENTFTAPGSMLIRRSFERKSLTPEQCHQFGLVEAIGPASSYPVIGFRQSTQRSRRALRTIVGCDANGYLTG